MAGVFAFELIPLPHDVPPITSASFSQSGMPEQTIALPDNWRFDEQRADLIGRYRIPLPAHDASSAWAIYIPNFSGQLTVAVNGVDISLGGILSGRLIPDQSVPFFALLPSVAHVDDAMIDLQLSPGG